MFARLVNSRYLKMMTPPHYAKQVTPWCLQKHMESSGDVFIDARRTDIMEYAFRIKGTKEDQRRDLEKVIHNAQAAILRMEELTKSQP